MPNFEYIAVDGSGTVQKGNIVSGDLTSAIGDLSKRGFKVEKIEVARSINDPLMAPIATAPVQNFQNGAVDPVASVNYSQRSGYDYDDTGVMPYQRQSSETLPPNERQTASPFGPNDGERVHEFGSPVVGPSTEARSYFVTNVVGPIIGKATLTGLGFFFRQLGTMLQAGVPYVQALDTLSKQSRDPRLRAIVEDGREQVKAGRMISVALQRYPESISPVMISLIRAGEEGGFLDKSLHQTADYIDREIELRNLYRRVTFYPKLIFVASFIIIAMANSIITVVAPGQQGIAVPFTVLTWALLIGLVIGIWLFLRVGLANYRVKRVYDKIILKVPVIGKTMHELAMAKFGRAFGALYSGGVPISRAMHLAADACGNEELRARMYPSFQHMDRGAGIYDTFKSTRAFSPIVLDMVGTGEQTGNMDQMLNKVASFYEDEAATKQTMVATIVGVFMFLIVAVYIGYIIIHFYTAYFGGIMKAGGLS